MSANQERWDVVLKVLSGPLAGLGEQVFRGPVVRIGASPGPGGFQLTGYRGLDARQAVITAYDGGTATVGPVGTNQVRMAPHANVNWKEIDPMTAPQYLSKGCALHMGPIGRGATIEFVECRRLGVWTKGDLASDVGTVNSVGVAGGQKPAAGIMPGMAQKAPPPGVRVVRTSFVPVWFIGCLMLMATSATAFMAVIGFFWFRQIKPLGPTEDGDFFREYVQVDEAHLQQLGLLDGLQGPFQAFVMYPNADAYGDRALATDPKNWDQTFYQHVAASVEQHVHWKNFFREVEQSEKMYASITAALQDAGMPEVLAGIPFQESKYNPEAFDPMFCAMGIWQFQPETAYRVGVKGNMDFRVKDCKFTDAPGLLWSPKLLAMPNNPEYVANGKCRMPSSHPCATDDRTDVDKSTAAAIYTFKEAYADDTFKSSGSLVQLTIMTNNMGYNDLRFKPGQETLAGNLLGTYLRWSKGKTNIDKVAFYGQNITCTDQQTVDNIQDRCNGALPRVTQNYVYPIVARHMLAVCYYAKNYPEEKAFARWTQFTQGSGYCTKFTIPSPGELK